MQNPASGKLTECVGGKTSFDQLSMVKGPFYNLGQTHLFSALNILTVVAIDQLHSLGDFLSNCEYCPGRYHPVQRRFSVCFCSGEDKLLAYRKGPSRRCMLIPCYGTILYMSDSQTVNLKYNITECVMGNDRLAEDSGIASGNNSPTKTYLWPLLYNKSPWGEVLHCV